MTLQEATDNMTAAIRDRDLTALESALADRAACIKAGAQPIPEIIAAGNRAVYDLLVLKQRIAFESARLEQLREGLSRIIPAQKRPRVDYRG